MKSVRGIFSGLLLASAVVAAGSTGSTESTGTAEPDFNLLGPEVTKIAWNTRSLVAADINGDDRTDLALINNDRARIELLYQRQPGEEVETGRAAGHERWEPVLEDTRFRRQSLATGIRMFALAIGDLDGDDQPDLAYTGSPDGLTVRYQGPRDDFGSKRVFAVDPTHWMSSILIADISGDGRNDLVVICQEDIEVFIGNARGQLEGPRSYALSEESCFGLRASDANRDGHTDLLFQVAGHLDPLRIRFGLSSGGFGPEHAFRLATPRGYLRPLPLPDLAGPALVLVQDDTELLEIVTIEDPRSSEDDHDSAEDELFAHTRPRIFSAHCNPKTPASYAVADFDGDGRPDIAIADGKGARTWLLRQEADGVFSEAVAFPSLADVRSVAAGDSDGDGRAELYLASPSERTIAVTSLLAEGRMSYPRPLPSEGKPWAVVVDDFDGDGSLDIAYTHEDKKKRGVTTLQRPPKALNWQPRTLWLSDIKTTPRGLRVVDANQDGRSDLAVFVAHEPVHLLLNQEDGGFFQATVESGFRKGLMDNVEAQQLTSGDVNGDHRSEILIASEGFARSLYMTADGVLEVMDQYNARTSDTLVAAAVVIELDGADPPEVVLIEQGGEQMQVLRSGSDGVYRHHESVQLGGIDLVRASVSDLDGNRQPDLLLFGKDRFLWLPVGASDLRIRSLGTYETDLRNVSYHTLAVGDLNHDQRQDIIAIDSAGSRVLEILTRGDDGDIKSALHFTIFDADPHFEGQRGSAEEPRQVLVCDLTGDGKDDLALLVHDRVLVYPQE